MTKMAQKKRHCFFWAIFVVNERFLLEMKTKKSKNVVSLDHFVVQIYIDAPEIWHAPEIRDILWLHDQIMF